MKKHTKQFLSAALAACNLLMCSCFVPGNVSAANPRVVSRVAAKKPSSETLETVKDIALYLGAAAMGVGATLLLLHLFPESDNHYSSDNSGRGHESFQLTPPYDDSVCVGNMQGACGIQNPGNACYLIAIIQHLCGCIGFKNAVNESTDRTAKIGCILGAVVTRRQGGMGNMDNGENREGKSLTKNVLNRMFGALNGGRCMNAYETKVLAELLGYRGHQEDSSELLFKLVNSVIVNNNYVVQAPFISTDKTLGDVMNHGGNPSTDKLNKAVKDRCEFAKSLKTAASGAGGTTPFEKLKTVFQEGYAKTRATTAIRQVSDTLKNQKKNDELLRAARQRQAESDFSGAFEEAFKVAQSADASLTCDAFEKLVDDEILSDILGKAGASAEEQGAYNAKCDEIKGLEGLTEGEQVQYNGPVAIAPRDGQFVVSMNRTDFGRKNCQRIEVPEEMSMSGTNYRLTAATVHLGDSLNSGHWITYRLVNDEWRCFNDGNVYRVTDKNAMFDSDYYGINRNGTIFTYTAIA